MAALVHHELTNYQPGLTPGRTAAAASHARWHRLARTLHLWRCRLRERTELAALNLRDMRDIGVTPSEVWNELRQPVWRSTLRR
jgi:uncharacterized protein YjiS (DUF1127 family)